MSEETQHTTWERTVAHEDAGMRLDQFWGRELKDEGVSRERVQTWIKDGGATVNGVRAGKPKHRVTPGELLVLRGEARVCAAMPEAGPLTVVYEDAHILVVDKPAGLTTHPAPSHIGDTLVGRLLHYYPELCDAGMDPLRPGIVHRLDKDTSGLMVVARTEKVRLTLAGYFADRKVDKVYLALAHGTPRQTGNVEAPMGRDPSSPTRMAVVDKGGRGARSLYRTLWTDPRGRASLVAVRILTGRTHQVRVHMAFEGHPLVGDPQYGPKEHEAWLEAGGPVSRMARRQMLHAFTLAFDHPETGERMSFRREPPEDFLSLCNVLSEDCLRVGVVGPSCSGKSALVNVLGKKGIPVFSADACVAELYASGGDGAAMVSARFGGEYDAPGGGVDKKKLFGAMRGEDRIRREVQDLIHPMVRHRMNEFFAEYADAECAFAEVALLLESGFADQGGVDLVAGVFCPAAKRAEFAEMRGLDPDMLAVFDSWQWPEDKKRERCDLVVENGGSLDDLRDEAVSLLERVRAERGRRTETAAREFAEMLDRGAGDIW